MAEERTIVVENPSRGSGAGWAIAIVLVIALVVGFLMFGRVSDSEAVKNNAIAGAAQDVGQAAQNVGNAAQDAANGGK